MNKKVAAIIAIVAVLAVIFGGAAAVFVGSDDSDDAGRDDGGSASPTATSDSGPVETGDLDSYYGQDLDWTACGDVECAKLRVPVDYQDPEAAAIELNLKRLPAGDQDARVGSVVVNPGGPGAPGTSMAESVESAGFYFRPQLLERVDIVAFDPRGTGESDPVDCLSDADLDAYLAEDPSPDDAAEADAFIAEQESIFAGCVENSDEIIGHVSTVEAARDLDVLRSALDEEKLAYLGFSYGTTLGSTYASLFPEHAGRMVLDGATDPTLDARQDALSQAAGFERALRSYVGNCVDGGDCFLGDSVEAGLDTITGLLDSVEETPLPTQVGRELAIGNAFYGVIAPLYNQDNWQYLDQGLQQALDGDGTILMVLADSYSSRDTTGDGFLDNSLEANLAINCLDDPSVIDPDDVPAQYPAFEKASPTFGDVFAWGLVGCTGVEVTATEKAPVIKAEGAEPILVLGTTRDPATPYEEAVALASQLATGVLISRDGDGHTAYNKGNDCIDEAVEGYLIDGTVPDDGLEC